MAEYFIAWWNLENLFDIQKSQDRPEWLKKALARELAGWTAGVLNRKVSQLASIIMKMNDGKGPDLLGVCEVENWGVLDKLIAALSTLGRSYGVAHHDTEDKRGIDIAFIYDAGQFTAHEQFHHTILKRSSTRDLFQVNFKTKSDRLLVAIGNHWPSRLGGQYESEPYRILAAETLSYWIERIQEIHGRDVPVLVMGDFNDEPFDRSMTEYASSERLKKKVSYARNPKLLNLMWPVMGNAIGTHYYDNEPAVLDQFLVSRGMILTRSDLKAVDGSAQVFVTEEMKTGRYEAPRRFGRPSKELDEDGFSDHFPITMAIEAR